VKNQLRRIPAQYPDGLLVHVGDRFADELEAANAGAVFVHVDALSWDEWLEPHHFYRITHALRGIGSA
jgi:phosphoglycolate phosphatase-like HAD superfamily hydrolase